ncbi:hypothetical protein OAE97_00745 [Verrucomicrobia bacterium]|nr:hypothetical protein [Verrucomicrobiota bacterium]
MCPEKSSADTHASFLLLVILYLAPFSGLQAQTQEKVFSGPQPGESTTHFDAIELRGDTQGETVDPILENAGNATTLVFVHGLERSMVPLMKVIDAFGERYKTKIKTEWVFLSDDPITSRQRLPIAGRSIQMKGRMLLSSDGIEGPGNYGLNKRCLLTVLTSKENKVTANFALIQPGIADAESILGALAALIGLEKIPDMHSFIDQERMTRRGMRGRGKEIKRKTENSDQQKLPGAAPKDTQLIALLRRYIQRTNRPEQVDQILDEVRAYIEGNKDLQKQAMDGWTRVISVQYGTAFARQQGTAFVKEIKNLLESKE